MSLRWAAVILSAYIALEPAAPPIHAQDAKRKTIASGDTGGVLPAPASTEIIRGFLNKSRGRLDQPAELAPFFERLHQISAGSGPRSVHILHFGDSHTAGDGWTGWLRSLFQERFGDGGSGFSLAGHPFPGYRRADASGGSTGGWKAAGLQSGAGDGYFGLGGVSLSTESPGQTVYLDAACDLLEVHYLQQPNGGDLALYEDGKLLEEFSTAGELKAEIRMFENHSGTHRYQLKTTSSRPVRIFGWVADKQQGMTYESLGLNGARASLILRWDEEMLGQYLRSRDPGLVVLAYGTNDAVGLQSSLDRYQEMFSTLLGRLRRLAPEAAILVIGPPDVAPKIAGRPATPTEVDLISAAQQNASRANGCAFWDMRDHMGGTGSMREWAAAGLAQRDNVHFSPGGYRQLADALFSDLMRYYDTYTQVRLQLLGRDSK